MADTQIIQSFIASEIFENVKIPERRSKSFLKLSLKMYLCSMKSLLFVGLSKSSKLRIIKSSVTMQLHLYCGKVKSHLLKKMLLQRLGILKIFNLSFGRCLMNVNQTLDQKVRALAEDKSINYSDALSLFREQQPDFYRQAFGG